MKREIKKNWYIRYLNDSNKCHQQYDKPSFIGSDGIICFHKNSKFHRQGKPAIIWSNGTLEYREGDKFVKIIQI